MIDRYIEKYFEVSTYSTRLSRKCRGAGAKSRDYHAFKLTAHKKQQIVHTRNPETGYRILESLCKADSRNSLKITAQASLPIVAHTLVVPLA